MVRRWLWLGRGASSLSGLRWVRIARRCVEAWNCRHANRIGRARHRRPSATMPCPSAVPFAHRRRRPTRTCVLPRLQRTANPQSLRICRTPVGSRLAADARGGADAAASANGRRHGRSARPARRDADFLAWREDWRRAPVPRSAVAGGTAARRTWGSARAPHRVPAGGRASRHRSPEPTSRRAILTTNGRAQEMQGRRRFSYCVTPGIRRRRLRGSRLPTSRAARRIPRACANAGRLRPSPR